MEEDGSFLFNRIGGVEDVYCVLFRVDYFIGRGWVILNYYGIVIGEEWEVCILRWRLRFFFVCSCWKGGVSLYFFCKNIINCDYFNEVIL